MTRLVVTLLLIPSVLLTQLAAAPHVHTGSEQESTQHLQPHLHFHLFRSAASHPDTGSHCACGSNSSVIQADEDTPWDHDADALYVEAATVAPERAKQDVSDSHLYAAPVAQVLSLDGNVRVSAHLTQHSDRLRSQNCPLYLRYLTLTI